MGSVMFPAIVVKDAGATFNFGAAPFKSFDNPGGVYTPLIQAAVEDMVASTSKEAFAVAGKRLPMALIIEPAKDLAEQVYQVRTLLALHIDPVEALISPVPRCPCAGLAVHVQVRDRAGTQGEDP